jgi:hypothetical protein
MVPNAESGKQEIEAADTSYLYCSTPYEFSKHTLLNLLICFSPTPLLNDSHNNDHPHPVPIWHQKLKTALYIKHKKGDHALHHEAHIQKWISKLH